MASNRDGQSKNLKSFYIDKFGFILREDNQNEAILAHDKFCLILRTGHGGFRYDLRHQKCSILLKPNEGFEVVLYIPIADVKKHWNALKSNGVEPLTETLSETPYADHDFEGFYVRDINKNLICFFSDWHGPYTPSDWDWNIEPKLTESLIAEYSRNISLEDKIKKVLNRLFKKDSH